MKIAVISDIHSNSVALDAVLNKIDSCDYIINLGDIVGYNNDPRGCIDRLLELKESGKLIMSLSGNHDYAVITGNYDGFNTYHGKKALDITRKIMGKNYIHKLDDLIFANEFSMRLCDSGIKFYHALLKVKNGNRKYVNIYPSNIKELLSIKDLQAVFVGHSHLQFNELVDNVRIINPGSVGQPRNTNPNAQYSIINISNFMLTDVELYNVEYDIKSVAISNNKLGMDIFLSQRLFLGI